MESQTFTKFNNFLGKIENIINNSYTDLETSKLSLQTQSDARPYEETEYNDIFTELETREKTMGQYFSKLSETKDHIERIINKINGFSSLITEVKQTINNQHLRSGLSGQLKQLIRNQPNSKSIIKSLPKPISYSLKKDEYIDAPFIEKGGKKNIQKKRKTLKRVYKH